MNKLVIALVAATLTFIFLAPSADASYFLIRDRDGSTGITNAEPGYGWYKFSGPYATFDEAIRAAGTGTISDGSLRSPVDFPARIPGDAGESFSTMAP